MFVIVVGGGKVGYYLSKSLMEEGHEVLIIEKENRKCQIISGELGVNVLEGDGSEVAFLEQAGAARADVVIAVTGEDEDNLVVCQVARHKFHVPRTIARLNNPKNEKVFRQLGIDVTVSSTELILAQIEQVLPASSLVHLLSLRNLGVNIVEVEIPQDSPALGRPVRELGIPEDCIISLVVRDNKETIIPFGQTMLEPGDQVIAITSEASKEALRKILIGETVPEPRQS
jgi:trk system potassium uptake protein TrkA